MLITQDAAQRLGLSGGCAPAGGRSGGGLRAVLHRRALLGGLLNRGRESVEGGPSDGPPLARGRLVVRGLLAVVRSVALRSQGAPVVVLGEIPDLWRAKEGDDRELTTLRTCALPSAQHADAAVRHSTRAAFKISETHPLRAPAGLVLVRVLGLLLPFVTLLVGARRRRLEAIPDALRRLLRRLHARRRRLPPPLLPMGWFSVSHETSNTRRRFSDAVQQSNR